MTETARRARRPILGAALCVSLAALAAFAAGLGAQAPVPVPTPAPDPGAAPPKGPPRLVLGENNHNYGRVIQGQLVEHVFTVRNDGDGPLLIKNVQAT
jgi:hypothetical protein